MERASKNEYAKPPSNSPPYLYDSLHTYDYIYQRTPLTSKTETSLSYDTAHANDPTSGQTVPKQCDNTEVKQVNPTLNLEIGPTIGDSFTGTGKRFVHAESLQPTDDDHGPHVWEPLCYPSGNQTVPKDVDQLVEMFNRSSDSEREITAMTITSYIIPQYYQKNDTTGLAKLFHCKCSKIQTLALNRIADLLFRHRISSCLGYQLLGCVEVIWGALRNNRNRSFIQHLSYIIVLILSTIYLWGISNPKEWDERAPDVKNRLKRCISEFPDQSMCSCLDESSKNLLWALECFMHCMEATCLHPSILQIGEWEQCLLLMENRSIIERKCEDMAYSEQMALSVLLLNLLNRVPESTEHILPLMEKSMLHLLKNSRCKFCRSNWNQNLRRMNSNSSRERRGHLSANVVAIGLIRAIHSREYKKETYTIMKNIIVMCASTSHLTKQMLMVEIEKLYFNRNYFMRLCGVELLGVESSNANICRGYIARSLSLSRLSLREDVIHKSVDVGHPFWIAILGNFGDIPVKINCLVPTRHCVLKHFAGDYKSNADRDQTADNWSTFVTLKILQCSGGHDNIVKLLVYQYFPLPFFFILENQPKRNFLEWLLSRRNENAWLRSETLIFIIKDALSALKFLHRKSILHRDLTACRCVISEESHAVKLHEFRLAKKVNVTGDDSKLATRWMAPESMRHVKFSQQTDLWMVGLFIWEVLTHGCWPFTEHSDKPTDVIMELVIYRHLKPAQFPCISDKLYELILRCLDDDPNSRITLEELEEKLGSIIQAETPLSPGMKGVIIPLGNKRQRRYPFLLEAQKARYQDGDLEPEMGIPRSIISQKPTVSYVNLTASRYTPRTVLPITEQDLVSDDQPQIEWRAMVHVYEPLFDRAVPYIDDLKSISGALKLEVNVEPNGDNFLRYSYPNGDTLLNLAQRRVYGSNIDSYIEILLNISKCVERFHRQGWIVRCITARDICVTGDKKICLLRLGRTAKLDENWLFDDVFEDRFNWLPLEVIRDKTYSRQSDVYMVAMTAYEMFSAIDLHVPRPVRNELGCIPFAVVPKRTIEDFLTCDEVPECPNSCPDWLYKILRQCWLREKFNRLTITELIAQIEKKLLLKRNNEKDKQVSTNIDPDDIEVPPDVPPRTRNPTLPPPCIRSYETLEKENSGLLSISDFDQFTLKREDSSSDNYPDETGSSDDLSIPSAISNRLQPNKDSQVPMRRKPGRRKVSERQYSDLEEHALYQNDKQQLERLERRSQNICRHQLMDISLPSGSSQEDVSSFSGSSQALICNKISTMKVSVTNLEDITNTNDLADIVPNSDTNHHERLINSSGSSDDDYDDAEYMVHFENTSESDTSACTFTTNRSNGISSTDNNLVNNMSPSLLTLSGSKVPSGNKACENEFNANNCTNVLTKKSKVQVDK